MHVVEEVTSKEQCKRDFLHSDLAHNKVDLSLKDKVYAYEG